MIQIYSPGNENYENNGDAVLHPSSCKCHFEVNSEWNLEMVHPLDERTDLIVENAVLKVPSPYGELLYEIKKMDKSEYDIQITAYPFFMKAKKIFIFDKRAVDADCLTALNVVLDGSEFTCESNIKTKNTCYFENMNAVEAINGDVDNSIIKRWGGEIAWINNKVIIDNRLGADNGARAEFGYNLNSVQESIDLSDLCTRIYPKAYNGYMLPDQESVDSPLIDNYPDPYPKVYEYQNIKLAADASNSTSEDDILCDTLDDLYAALREAAANEFANGVDKPSIQYTVDMVDLSRLDNYKDFKDLLVVQLGDTVHVKHRRLGIETSQRVLSIDYDCILQKIDSMSLGTDVTGYFDQVGAITSTFNKVVDTSTNTLLADKVKGIIDASNAYFKAQKNIAHKQDIRAMLFEDLDSSSETFGAMCLGTQGIQISKKRNEENTDWVWGTAINFESIIADYIITGILSDKSGNFYLNMDTGELVMNDGTFKGDLDTKNSIKIGDKLILANALNNFQGGYEGHIYVGDEGSETNILMRDADDYPMSGNNYRGMFLNAGDVSIGLTSENSNKKVFIDAPNGININGNNGLTGTYTVSESLTVNSGLVTGVK